MLLKWIAATSLIIAGLTAVQARAQTPAAQLTCTGGSQVLSIDLIGYDLDLQTTTSTTGSAAKPNSPIFTADTKLDKNFLALFNAYVAGKVFLHCNVSRSEDPAYEATFTDVTISELQVIDSVSARKNGNGSAPYVEITLMMRSIAIEPVAMN
jgi:hypothetical protein